MHKKIIKVLLIAVGGYGENYLKELTQNDTNAKIVGICDITPNLIEKYPVIAEKDIPVYTDIEAFYKNDTADLAVISAPIHFHAAMSQACMRAGSHVLCEKPFCTSMEEAIASQKVSQETGKFLALGYQMNFRRDIWQLKQDILQGKYGAPLKMKTVHAMRRGNIYYARNGWAGRITANGRDVFDSPFNNACAHQFQLMSFLIGNTMEQAADVTSLQGEIYRANHDVENYDTAALRFTAENGTKMCYYTSHALIEKNVGPTSTYEFEDATISLMPQTGSFKAVTKSGIEIDYSAIDPGKRLQKLYDALDCIENGTTPICGLQAEYAHIKAVQMVQQLPIQPVQAQNMQIVNENGERFCCINNLAEIFTKCANEYALPKELGYLL